MAAGFSAVSAGGVVAYGGLLLLSSWRVAVHCRARANLVSSFRKRTFHGLAAAFSGVRLAETLVGVALGNALPRVQFELSSLGTWLFFLQFLVVVTKWATATSASNSARTRRILLAAKVAGTVVTVGGVTFAVLAAMLPMSATKKRAKNSSSSSGAEPTAPTNAALHMCDYEYETSLGLSVEIIGVVSCLILSAGFIYYGYMLRLHVLRLSTIRTDRSRTADRTGTAAATMRVMSEVSAQRRRLVGNAGCLIRVYGLVSTFLFLGRAAMLILLVVRPMCCGDLDDGDDCLDVSGVKLIFELLCTWIPEVVPTLLMMHLMWSPGGGRTSVSLKSLRLSKIIRKTGFFGGGGSQRAVDASGGVVSASLRAGLLGASHMERGRLETKQKQPQLGHHIIRSDSHELYRSTSTESTSLSTLHQVYLGSPTLSVPLAHPQTQPLLGAVDFYRQRRAFIPRRPETAQRDEATLSTPNATVKRLNRSDLGVEDDFCKASTLYRAYEYSQSEALTTPTSTNANISSAGAPTHNRLLFVEQLAEAPCLFAVPHQLLRLLLCDQQHHLNMVSRSIRNLAKDSVRAFENRTGSSSNLSLPMYGGGGGNCGGGAGDGPLERSIKIPRENSVVGNMYENALAMIKEDAEERELTEWLFKREHELSEYVADMERALRELERATTGGSILVDTDKLKAIESRSTGYRTRIANTSPDAENGARPGNPGQLRTGLESPGSSKGSPSSLSSPLLSASNARVPPEQKMPPPGINRMMPFSFKPSSTKGMHKLRFLPTNLHLHDCFVTPWPTTTSQAKSELSTSGVDLSSVRRVYSTVTCGAPAAHCYGFKDGKGVRQLQQALADARRRLRQNGVDGINANHGSSSLPSDSTMRSTFGVETLPSIAASSRAVSQSSFPLNPVFDDTAASKSTRLSQSVESIECHKLEWEIKKRIDVAWVQATTQLVAAFCRQLDNVLACGDDHSAVMILSQWFEIGFLVGFESLLSTSGQESGMLGDAEAAISKLAEIQLFVLIEGEEGNESSARNDTAEEGESKGHSVGNFDSTPAPFGRVAYERGFKLTSASLSLREGKSSHLHENSRQKTSLIKGLDDSDSDTDDEGGESGGDGASAGASKRGTTLDNLRRMSSAKLSGGPFSDPNGRPVFNITVRLSASVPEIVRNVFECTAAHRVIKVVPVLFTQGVNERQTAANYVPMGLMGDNYLQHEINIEGTQRLTAYFRSYDGFVSRNPLGSNGGHGSCSKRTVAQWYTTEELRKQLHCLTTAVRDTKVSVKNVRILLLAQVLCRGLNGGRITMCKSGKDRTAMSVTLEQARLLVVQHGVPTANTGMLVEAFRRDGVRRDCVMKNIGVTCYAFNRLQRALLPRELQAPEETCGMAVS